MSEGLRRQAAGGVGGGVDTLGELDVAAMREATVKRALTRAPGPSMDTVDELDLGGSAVGLRGRLYRPAGGPLPLILHLHGGGWTIGNLDTHDRLCRRLADGTRAAVVALDYRLAPEHPWPASVQDAVTALRWIATWPGALGEMTGLVAVSGDSAGGALAALACLRLRSEDPAALPALQVLLNANTDLASDLPSMREKRPVSGLMSQPSSSSIANGFRIAAAGATRR